MSEEDVLAALDAGQVCSDLALIDHRQHITRIIFGKAATNQLVLNFRSWATSSQTSQTQSRCQR